MQVQVATSRIWCWAFLVAVLAGGIVSTSAAGDDRSEEVLRKELAAVQRELATLVEGDGAPRDYREFRKVQRAVSELRAEHQKELRGPQERLRALQQREAVQQWQEKIRRASEQRNELYRSLQSAIHTRAREQHEQRKRELAAIAAAEVPEAGELGFSVFTYPIVDGSTSAQPLGTIIACKVLGCPYQWEATSPYSRRWGLLEESADVSAVLNAAWGPPAAARAAPAHFSSAHSPSFTLTGYRPVPTVAEGADRKSARLATIIRSLIVHHSGTHGAYENVIRGNAELGLVARRPSPDELELAKGMGVQLSVTPVAMDAFVFIKNHENPVDNLTTGQIRAIYAGEVSNWKDVGGADQPIRAYMRNDNSGSHELMKSLVMKDTPFYEPERGHRPGLIQHGMGGPYLVLSHDQRGLAYSVYYYEHFMAGSPNTEVIAVDGVVPSHETIRTGKYPYATEVYAVMRADAAPDSDAARLRAWVLSDEGQAVVRESGYVPVKGP